MTDPADRPWRAPLVRQFAGLPWDERFGAPPRRFRLIAKSRESAVWRVLGRSVSGDRMYILKLTQNTGALRRELAAHEQVVSRLQTATPAVLGGGAFGRAPGGYILFADDRLRSAHPRRVEEMARVLARLHATPLRDLALPETARSHTPEVAEVARRVDRVTPGECDGWLAPFAPCEQGRRAARDILGRLQGRSASLWEETAPALCHGDAHAGNFMAAPRGGRLRLIDWEFVHVDHPYFDIFQLLDATSPHTALPVFPSRLLALSSYHAAATGGLPPLRRFAQGYLQYALVHLFWILSLIHEDARQGRHSAPQLMRQGWETGRLIGDIARDWRLVGDG